MRLIFTYCLCLLAFGVFAQKGPKSGTQPASFSGVPNDLGFLSNSINQATGQVQFSLPLMSIGSKSDLSYDLSLSYSSANIKNQVETWNREAPTSCVGLGWSFSYPKIVCDYKGTAIRHDDNFYLVTDNISTELIGTGNTGTNYNFRTKDFKAWKITYATSTETWTIIDENGKTFTYGDQSSGRNTIQYMIRWQNWIGDGYDNSGSQSRHAYVWNLSKIENVNKSDYLTFEYQVEEETVRGGILKHTRASYLKEIKNVNQDRITLNYLAKTNTTGTGGITEFVDVHSEAAESDAYQEKYETMYLDKLVFNTTSGSTGEVRLGYDAHRNTSNTIITGELYKRQLASVTQYQYENTAYPGGGVNFQYDITTYPGALLKVTSPTKGYVSFVYEMQQAQATARKLNIPAVAGYTEPRIFIGEDYVVVTRRNTTTHATTSALVMLDVYTWEGGKWNKGTTAYLDQVQLKGTFTPRNQDFQVVLGKNFFATLNQPNSGNSFRLTLFGRSDYSNTWVQDATNIYYSSASVGSHDDVYEAKLLAGKDFVLVGSKTSSGSNSVKQFLYTFDGSAWTETIRTAPSGTYNYTATNNYYVTHNYAPSTDEITLNYKTMTGVWGISSISTTIQMDCYGDSYWYPSNSFLVLMGYGPAEYIIWWDNTDNYTGFHYQTFSNFRDDSFVTVMNDNMFTVTDILNTGSYSFRFTGNTWNTSAFQKYDGPSVNIRNLVSMGNDFVTRPWNNGSSKFSRVVYNPNTNLWTETDMTVSSPNNFACIAGYNFIFLSGTFFIRDKNGAWNASPNTVNLSWSTAGNNITVQAGLDFVTGGRPDYPGAGNPPPYPPFAASIKNGAVVPSAIETFPMSLTSSPFKYESIWDYPNQVNTSAQASNNILVTYVTLDAAGPAGKMEDASELNLYRKIQGSLNTSGNIPVFVAKSIISNDGITSRYTSNEYDLNYAFLDPEGNVPYFNKVTSFADNDAVFSTKPVGYTNSYFFNNMIAYGEQAFPLVGGNSATKYRKLLGMPYKSVVYDNAGTLKSKSTTDYDVITMTNKSIATRQAYQTDEMEGGVIRSIYSYNANNQVSDLTTQNMNSSTAVNPVTKSYIYYWEKYTATTNNLIAPVIGTTTTVGSTVTDVAVTQWDTYNTTPGPSNSYVWRRTNSSTFSTWGSTPSSTYWKLQSHIEKYDETRGLALDVEDGVGNRSGTVWHPSKLVPLARVENEFASNIVYEGFETLTTGFILDGRLGEKSKAGAYSKSSLPSKTYKVTYWYKPSGGQWTYKETSVTGTLVSINEGTTTLLDEIRICPGNAQITSYAYDRFGNLIGICDPNNIITKYEYDEFNRPRLTRDQDGNITEYSLFNTRN